MSDVEKKKEIRILLERILSNKISNKSESEFFERINVLSPDPEWSDYVFHSNEFENSDGSFNFEGFLEKVFDYKPIPL